MVKIKSVLAATDFSLGARHAAERAAMLATTLTMQKGTLLHVLEESWVDSLKKFVGISVEIEQGVLDETSRSLDTLIWEIRKELRFAFESQVRIGNTLNTIIDVSSDSDLLVLGAQGEHPVKTLALGTTSQRLLSKTQKPVLVVKRKPEKPYQRVFVAVDFSPNSAKALEYSKIIAPEALISVVHVFEPIFEPSMVRAGISDEIIEQYRINAQIEAEKDMTDFIKDTGMDSKNLLRLLEYGHAPAKLPEMAQQMYPDLVIVGKHGRSRIEELLVGSVTLHLLSESKCDVLVAQ